MKIVKVAAFSLATIWSFFPGGPLAAGEIAYELTLDAPAFVWPGGEFTATLKGAAQKDLTGYSAMITYDPAFLSLLASDFTGTEWGSADYTSAVNDPLQGKVNTAAVMDQDGTGPSLVTAGSGLPFLRLTFKVLADAGSTTIGFLDLLDANVLADEDLLGHDSSNGLLLGPATVEIAEVFIRADCDMDRLLIITDVIYFLAYEFLGAMEPQCFDACDSNDDELLNIADPIYYLNFNYLAGSPPPAPFPLPGKDPTPGEGGRFLDCREGLR